MTHVDDAESDYAFSESSDQSDSKVISLSLNPEPVRPPSMRLHIRLSKDKKLRVALVDAGCGTSYINAKLLAVNKQFGRELMPTNLRFEQVDEFVKAAGTTEVPFRFMDLNYNSRITHSFAVIPNTKDEMVIGRDLLGTLGMIVNFRDSTMEWNGTSVALNTGKRVLTNDMASEQELDAEMKEVNEAPVLPVEMIGEATIDQHTHEKVLDLLTQYQDLYNGHLGRMKLPDYILPVTEYYRPVHSRPYTIPKSQEKAVRNEIQRLIERDVLEQLYDSEMASPAFFLTKPDGRLRLLNDFRGLNKFLQRSPYYVPVPPLKRGSEKRMKSRSWFDVFCHVVTWNVTFRVSIPGSSLMAPRLMIVQRLMLVQR